MQDLINTATTSFLTTTGFDVSEVITYMIGLLQQGIGLGLGVLQQTWPVLLAIGAILGVVFIARKAWAFFHPNG